MRNEKKWLFAIVFVIALLYLYSLSPIRYLGNVDSGHYLIISKSLVEKHGYYGLSSPSDAPFSSTLILPVYPLLLSPVFLFADGSFFVARLISAVFGIASLFVFYYIAREFFDPKESLFIMAIVGLSPFMMIYSRTILTEVPYTFFSLTALLLLHKSGKNKNLNAPLFLGGIFVLLSSLTRMVGITLFASSILYYAMKKQYKKVAYFMLIIASFIIVGYLINYYFFYSHPPTTAYQPTRLFGRIIGNITGYLFYFIPMNVVTPMVFLEEVFGEGAYLYFIGFLVSLMMGLGFIRQVKGGVKILHIHMLIFTAFIFLNAKISGNGRYMMPILLFFTIFFLDGLKHIVNKTKALKLPFPDPTRLYSVTLLVLLSSSFFGGVLLAHASHYREVPPAWENYFKAADWIKTHSSENDIIMVARHNDFYLFSNRKVVPPSKDPEDVMNIIEKYNVKYVMDSSIGGDSQEEWIVSTVSKNIDNFELTYSTESPVARVYEVKIPPEH